MKTAVIGKKQIAIAFVLSAFVLIGVSRLDGGKVAQVAAPARELPIYSVETTEKVVALGINCAWDNADIPVILEVLEQAQVKATFFILGEWCDKYPESVRKIAQAGHEIASHSNSHASLDTLSRAEIAAEVTASMEKLALASGQQLRLIRPPSGAYNNLAISTIKELGYMPIQWDVEALDMK